MASAWESHHVLQNIERLILIIWNCTCDPRFLHPNTEFLAAEACQMSYLG